LIAATKDADVHRIALASIEQRFSLKAPENFPLVGLEFATDGAEFTATSHAKWNGKTAEITVALQGKSIDKISITAPVTYALSKAGTVAAILPLVMEFATAPLPLDAAGSFTTVSQFDDVSANLYVVEQPITFTGPTGRTCLVAPVYSPFPIPAKFLRCNLF
jgi:hypothetical protein